ncbi:MAG: hypothetical protein QM607_02050 [Microbacterium sp.]
MAAAAEILRLQSEISRMQRTSARVDAIPVHEALAPLFPDGGLRPGASYSLAQEPSLLFALMAEPSRAGSWCAAVGMPDLSAEAAEAEGVDLDRFVLVPDPGERWMATVSTIAEVFPVVAVRPPSAPRDADVARLAARLRDRGCVLLVVGVWPQAELTLQLADPQWSGIASDGHGLLAARTVTVTAAGRRSPVPRSVRIQLPGPLGAPSPVRRLPPREAPRSTGPLTAQTVSHRGDGASPHLWAVAG